MAQYAANYAIWTGVVGSVLEYYKKRGVGWEKLLLHGFAEKAIVGLISTWLQNQNISLFGNGLDANYIYNGVVGAATTLITKNGVPLNSAEEQIFCALIGHRLAQNWATAFQGLTSNIPFINNMFAGSSGYSGADIPNQGTSNPSQASGNPPMSS